MNVSKWIRPSVRKLHAYVPGEQPKIKGLIKLNTNENPYPPSPKVLSAVKKAADGRLRLYPNPSAQPLREALAKLHGCGANNICVGNGSDELLALATRAFVEPLSPDQSSRKHAKSTIQYFTPSYSLYPVLADIHKAIKNPVPLGPEFGIPSVAGLKRDSAWRFDAALTYITTPNAPSGRGYRTKELEQLCRVQHGMIILDEAYVDFAEENALELALRLPNVIVSRTFSKSFSLCFQRVGYFVGHPQIIAALDRIRDSYNVNGLGQLAAQATLQSLGYYRRNIRRIIDSREWLQGRLDQLGFETLPSCTNFLLTRPPLFPAEQWQFELKRRGILIRWFRAPEVQDYIRITIGSRREANKLIEAVRSILSSGSRTTKKTAARNTGGRTIR